MVNRALSITAGGITVDLSDPESLAFAGLSGMGMVQVEPRWLTGAGDGSIYRGARQQSRTLIVPVVVTGDTDADVQGVLDDLSLILAPDNAPARLTLTLDPDESDAESWWVDVVRTGGGDWEWGETAGDSWVISTLELTAGDPAWTSTALESVTWPTFGAKSVTNPGTSAAWPTFTIEGPSSGFTLTSPGGLSLAYEEVIGSGVELTVDMRAGTVKQGATNMYAGLAAAPRFWSLPPGASSITVTVPDSGVGTAVSMSYYPRRALMF